MAAVEGRQPVLEALRADQEINKILTARGLQHKALARILALARQRGIVVQEVERSHLDSISETGSHQGVIAQLASVTYWELETLLGKELGREPLFLVLDHVQDPHNLGSLVRSAEVHGATAVIIPKRRAAAVTPSAAKASAGAVSHIPICRVTNVVQAVKRLKTYGCWVVGAEMGAKACDRQDLGGPLALIVGGEGSGLSRLAKESCDFLVSIPMFGQISSLNAGVAGGILLYEIRRQRRAGNPS